MSLNEENILHLIREEVVAVTESRTHESYALYCGDECATCDCSCEACVSFCAVILRLQKRYYERYCLK